MRNDGRTHEQMRPMEIIRDFTKHALGSVLISYGDTKVLCTASVEDRVPPFLRDSGEGWITAEYSLLPSSTHPRAFREVKKGKQSGRTNEIQRLIGRSLRSIIDLKALGERTIYIDADVLQADGGTRTAAITGSMVAIADAFQKLRNNGDISSNPIKEYVGAISVGVVNGQVISDLCYEEDSRAEVDMNVVMTESGKFVEIQGTAETQAFSPDELQQMLSTAKHSIDGIIQQIKN